MHEGQGAPGAAWAMAAGAAPLITFASASSSSARSTAV
jgi:hypothetical protein